MTVAELIAALGNLPPEQDVMVVREDDHSDWANLARIESNYFDPLDDDETGSPITVIYVE